MLNQLRKFMGTAVAIIFIAAAAAPGTRAQAVDDRFRAGEMLFSVDHGTPVGDVQALADSVNATIVHSFGPVDFEQRWDLYYIRVKLAISKADTLSAVKKLKTDPRIVYAGANHIALRDQAPAGVFAIPNDPRFGEQWGMTMMNMPQAWTLEKGSANVVLGIIDTGVDIDHPEFVGRFITPINAFDPTNITTNPRPGTAAGDEHGTHVAGIAIAATNNGVGVAGVAGWGGVSLLPIKVDLTSLATGEASIIAAWLELIKRRKAAPNLRFVVNNSYNLGDSTTDTPPPPGTDPADDALLNVAKNDIIMVMSGGNLGDVNNVGGGGADTNPPRRLARMAAAHPNIFSVAAVSILGARAYYSSFRPTNTIAAPGGDALQGRLILSTFPVALGSYGEEQGTSMAAPHVTGVIALVLSIPGVATTDVKSILTSTARRVPGAALPSPEYGFGIVDAYAALLKVAVAVTILEPQGTGGKASGNTQLADPIETLRPAIRIQVAQIVSTNLQISIDGGSNIPVCPLGVPVPSTGVCYTIENVTATAPDPVDSTKTIPSVYEAVLHNVDLAPGQHTINVTGTKPGSSGTNNTVVSDTRTFSITPHIVPAGRAMVSFPYYAYVDRSGSVVTDPHDPGTTNQITPQVYFGTNFRLARWLPDQERYVFYSSFGQSDNAASFTPLDVLPRQDGDPARPEFAKWPLGLGFWSDTESNKPILTKGVPVTDRAFIIPLKGNGSGDTRFISWNMIGDPFPFDVPFNSILVDTPVGRVSLQEAADKGFILPNVYTYDGSNGYTYRTLPDGALRAWTGYWVGVTSKVDISLVVPPAKLSRAAKFSSASSSGTGWKLQIGAHVKNLNDAYNFIGMASRAQDGYDKNDVAKPPMPGSYVSLGIRHTDWAEKSGLFAQDIRSSGPSKSWSISVDSDQPNSDITVSWNSATLPKNVKLIMKDDSTGQTYDMRSRAALTFNSGADAASRKFTITAAQSIGGPLRIANLNVRGAGRGSASSIIGFNLTGDATYEVKVLNAAGTSIGTIATRAAAGGGDVSVIWNGRDGSGKSVASGTYLVQVRATTTEGDSVKAIQPFTVVR